MDNDATRMGKAYFPILTTVFVLGIFALPCLSFSAQSIYTIQLGSYLSTQGVNRHYDSVLKKLNPQDRGSLRTEKVGKYYALRLGVFENSKEEAERVFRKVKAVNPGAIMLSVKPSKRKIVSSVASTTVEDVPVPPVETAVPPVAESVAILSLSEPEPPAQVRETAAYKVQPVILTSQNVRGQAPVAVQGSKPLIPDSLLIGFSTIIVLFMFEQYIRTLARLGRFESLKWLFAGSDSAEWLTERKYVVLPEMGEELQIVFKAVPITPVAYLVDNDSVLADESHAELRDEVVKNEAEEIYLPIDSNGPADLLNNVWLAEYGVFDLDEGRFCPDDEGLSAAEEVTEIKLEEPVSQNLHTVVPRASPRKGQTGRRTDNKIGNAENEVRENRVARSVLAVSFFADE